MADQRPNDEIVSGPIVRTVFALAIPVTLGMLMQVALSLTNFFWVGRLGATAQDAITSSMVIIWTVFSAISIITIGITALVARYVGARDYELARFFIRQSMWYALGLGTIVGVVGYVWTPACLQFMDTGPATFHLAVPYLRVFFLATLFLVFLETVFAVFRASGDTRTPMKIGVLMVVVNMILDPVLIFGVGPIPAFGVTGAGVATSLSYALGAILCFRVLRCGGLGYDPGPLFGARPDLKAIGKMTQIGLPVSTQQLVFVVVYWFLIKYVHEFGEAAGAAMGIGNRMESISYLTCYGFSLAAATMIGQNLGAGKPDRAARCVWGATGLGVAVTAVMSFFFIATPGLLASVFTDDPQVHRIAIDYLIILGVSQSAMAVEIVLEGAFSGAGNTIPPMLVMLPGAAARIPLAWFLAFELGWGINGVWWTLTITCIAKAIVLAWWFSLGRWKTRAL